ncbi:uncharacterized protein [Amphiura filiformis]|uniref:uncharacterized protein n=1 Tax=Amphiura filiformis TaxID=82378 RepID=UPI003B218495
MDLEEATKNMVIGSGFGTAPFATNSSGHQRPAMSLSDAIHSLQPYDKIVQIIEDNPAAVKDKGWHGLTPMHKAGLRGDRDVTKLLMQHGANINEPNDYGETPVHYACKRGNPVNIHEMVQAGGDIRVTDSAGRNALHHAASGGCVAAMHYLSEVCGMSFNDRDRNGQMAIHIVCYQGFQDAVKYLLRKQRSSVSSTDNFGNTAIHIACVNALSETCWTLLENSNCAILTQQNRDGKTPLDILLDGRTSSHLYVYKEMEYWSRSRNPKAPPKGPLFTWFFMLLLPFLAFSLIVYIGTFLGWYSSLVVCAMTLYLVGYVGFRSHRLSHISRWSNPVFCGAFAAGLIHTSVCYCVILLPDLWYEQPVFHIIIAIPLILIMFYLYIYLLLREPGGCRISKPGPTLNDPCMTIKHVALGLCKLDEFCPQCEIIKPERCRHCKLCEQCRIDMDHHCLFLLGCIAKNNHRQFVIFIFIVLIAQIMFVCNSMHWLVLMYPHGTWYDLSLLACQFQCWLLALMMLNFASIFWGVNLLKYQLGVVSYGVTTVWKPHKCVHSRLPWRHRLNNVMNFLAGKRTLTADDVYSTHKI